MECKVFALCSKQKQICYIDFFSKKNLLENKKMDFKDWVKRFKSRVVIIDKKLSKVT